MSYSFIHSFIFKGVATSFFDPMRDERIARGLVKLLTEGEQVVPDWFEATAMNAVGTGYGDNRVVSDQRARPQNYGAGRYSNNGGGACSDDEEW